MDNTRESLDQISKVLKPELEAFDREKASQIKDLILLLIRHNMDVHLQIVDQWKTMLGDLHSEKEIIIELKD